MKEIIVLKKIDFLSITKWKKICKIANVSPVAGELVIEFVRSGISEETLKEIK